MTKHIVCPNEVFFLDSDPIDILMLSLFKFIKKYWINWAWSINHIQSQEKKIHRDNILLAHPKLCYEVILAN